jgi:hypothetical protein
MNRLFCFLSGGHEYADKNLTATMQRDNTDMFVFKNKCVKCGKVYEVKLNMGAVIQNEITKMKGGEE